MKRIVTIFTGGTIGSRQTDLGEISPDRGSIYRLLEAYGQCGEKDVEFVVEKPYYILSENLSGKELVSLAACVERYVSAKNEIKDSADGIVILHGTDTLQYSAAFLEFLFGNAPIPILLVSSAYPLEDKRANGWLNFSGAVDFIRGRYGTGVFVSYANDTEKVKIHSGMELLRSKEYSADVCSRKENIYGEFKKEGGFYKNASFKNPTREQGGLFETYFSWGADRSFVLGSRTAVLDGSRKREIYLTEFCDGVLRVCPYPGMAYPEIPATTKAVLMESYHSGTIGISDRLKAFMEEAAKRKIFVYLTGLDTEDADYETAGEYQKLGVYPLRDKTVISQYVKLWLILSNGLDIRTYMERKTCEFHLPLL